MSSPRVLTMKATTICLYLHEGIKKKKGITNKLKNIIYLDIDNDFLSLRKLEIFLNNAKGNYIEFFPLFSTIVSRFFSLLSCTLELFTCSMLYTNLC